MSNIKLVFLNLNRTIKIEKQTNKKYNKSDVICNYNYSFYRYYRFSKEFDNISFKSKYSFPAYFFNDLNKFNKLKTQKKKQRKLQNYIVTCWKPILMNTMIY